jgi:hypothetical protein
MMSHGVVNTFAYSNDRALIAAIARYIACDAERYAAIKSVMNFTPQKKGLNVATLNGERFYANNCWPPGRIDPRYLQASDLMACAWIGGVWKPIISHAETTKAIIVDLVAEYSDVISCGAIHMGMLDVVRKWNLSAYGHTDLYSLLQQGIIALDLTDPVQRLFSNVANFPVIVNTFHDLVRNEDMTAFLRAGYVLRVSKNVLLRDYVPKVYEAANTACYCFMMDVCNNYLPTYGVTFTLGQINARLGNDPLSCAKSFAIDYKKYFHTEYLIFYDLHVHYGNQIPFPMFFVSWLYMCPSCHDLWARVTPSNQHGGGHVNTLVVSIQTHSQEFSGPTANNQPCNPLFVELRVN